MEALDQKHVPGRSENLPEPSKELFRGRHLLLGASGGIVDGRRDGRVEAGY
jgi:hypothetical protein